MTGTAKTQQTEFEATYNIGVIEIPTNRDMIRADDQDQIFKNEEAKWNALLEDIVERHEDGQPILVGTVSIEKSELLSGKLNRRGVQHHVLNAKNHEKEAMIVAQAGRKGAVVVATNMAGRGVDILLGGNPEYLARQEMAARDWDNDRYLLFEMDDEERAGYEADYEPILQKFQAQTDAEHDEVVGAGRALRAGHRAARVAAHRQPAARPFRPSGGPGGVDVLPLAGGRPDAVVRERSSGVDHGAVEVAGRGGHHRQDGHPGRGERAEADRGAQLRAPQERPEVRRRDEPPARGHLRRASQDPRGLRLRRPGARDGRAGGRQRRPAVRHPGRVRGGLGSSKGSWSRSPRSIR